MQKLYQAVSDKDNGVFKGIPNYSDKQVPYCYKEVNRYFVDNSGFGQADEPALTAQGFINKIKQGLYYAIVEQGQFQVYIGEFTKSRSNADQTLKDKGLISRKKLESPIYVTQNILEYWPRLEKILYG